MRTHPVTSLMVTAMHNATARYNDIPAKQRKYLEWRRYNALITEGMGSDDNLPAFLTGINYIRNNTPFGDDDVFLRIWNDELDGVLTKIQSEAIVTKLDTANPDELERFVRSLIRYIKRNVH